THHASRTIPFVVLRLELSPRRSHDTQPRWDTLVPPLLGAADEVSVKNRPFWGRGEGEPRHLQAALTVLIQRFLTLMTSEMPASCSRRIPGIRGSIFPFSCLNAVPQE